MNSIKLDNGIFVVHNFLSENEIEEYNNFIKNNNDKWISANFTTNKAFDNNLLRMTDEMYDKLKQKIRKLDIPGTCINLHAFIQRFQNGQSMNTHTDEPHNGIVSGIIVYINDNYLNGEIVYPGLMSEYSPKKTLMYKPKPGDLVFHDARIDHKVNEVFGSDRYAITAFKNSCEIFNCDGIECFNKSTY